MAAVAQQNPFMFKHLLTVFLAIVSFVYGDIHDFTVGSISYEWESAPNFGQCRTVCVDAFVKCYDPIPLEVLNKSSREAMIQWLNEAFDDDYRTLGLPGTTKRWLTAKEEGIAIGFLEIDLEKYPEEVYLALMAVDPNHQRLGIAKSMVSALFEQLSEAKRFVVITRIANQEARRFYHAIGFRDSSYMHPGYSREVYIGFEYD